MRRRILKILACAWSHDDCISDISLMVSTLHWRTSDLELLSNDSARLKIRRAYHLLILWHGEAFTLAMDWTHASSVPVLSVSFLTHLVCSALIPGPKLLFAKLHLPHWARSWGRSDDGSERSVYHQFLWGCRWSLRCGTTAAKGTEPWVLTIASEAEDPSLGNIEGLCPADCRFELVRY